MQDKKRRGRPTVTVDDSELVASVVEEMKSGDILPTTRNVANRCQLCNASVRKILRIQLRQFPYKLQIGQHLSDEHKVNRVKFCEWFLKKFDGSEVYSNVLFSDEAYFGLDAVCNRQNTRFWGLEKPTEIYEKATFTPKLLAWCGVVFLPLCVCPLW